MPSKLDKRAINIEITPEGKKALISCSEKSTYFLADMFHDFTTDEIETFWRLLQNFIVLMVKNRMVLKKKHI